MSHYAIVSKMSEQKSVKRPRVAGSKDSEAEQDAFYEEQFVMFTSLTGPAFKKVQRSFVLYANYVGMFSNYSSSQRTELVKTWAETQTRKVHEFITQSPELCSKILRPPVISDVGKSGNRFGRVFMLLYIIRHRAEFPVSVRGATITDENINVYEGNVRFVGIPSPDGAGTVKIEHSQLDPANPEELSLLHLLGALSSEHVHT